MHIHSLYKDAAILIAKSDGTASVKEISGKCPVSRFAGYATRCPLPMTPG